MSDERKAKWTPGEWRVHPKFRTAVETDGGMVICSTGGHQNNAEDPRALLTRQESDARLIAKAPRMAELLDRYCNSEVTGLLLDQWEDEARALLAEIEGDE